MSYIARSDVELKSVELVYGRHNTDPLRETFMPQAVFELENGDLIAVHYCAKRTPLNTVSARIVAWLVDAQGDAQQSADLDGEPIAIDFKHNAPVSQLTQLTATGLAAAMRDLALGEPKPEVPPIDVSDDVRDGINVRNAIAAARAVGETVDLYLAESPILPPPPVEEPAP